MCVGLVSAGEAGLARRLKQRDAGGASNAQPASLLLEYVATVQRTGRRIFGRQARSGNPVGIPAGALRIVSVGESMQEFELTVKNYRCFADDSPAKLTLGGGFTALLGPNNCGKSSLLELFFELRQPIGLLADVSQLRQRSGPGSSDSTLFCRQAGFLSDLSLTSQEPSCPVVPVGITRPPSRRK